MDKLTNLVQTFFHVFPDSYWEDLFKHRLHESNEMLELATNIFTDIFQFTHKPSDDHKTTQVLVFCTIPKISECWDTVLASYTVLIYKKFGKVYPPSTIANLILEVFVVGLKGIKGMFRPENIENFDRTVLEYLINVKEGNRGNKFFSDPEDCVVQILDAVEQFGIKSGTCNKGFYDGAKSSVKEILNKPEIKAGIQREIDQLFKTE